MNLTSSQFVVIDDKAIHLNAISDALNELGGACLKIDYTEYDEDAISQKKSIYNGVRVIFSDLHLVDGTTASDTNAFYSIITGVLATILDKHHPPYLLILWTEDNRTDHIEKLNSYFDDLNQEVKKPIQILSMSKHDFIDTTTGEIKEGTNKLQATLQEKIQSNIGLNALYQWDYEARKAVNETLFELEQLVISQAIAASSSFNESVSTVLNELGKEAVGEDHIDNNPLQALNLALSPIIQDKLISRNYDPDIFDWGVLINTEKAKQLIRINDINVVGKYNKLLHLSAYHPNSYQATDLGVVSVYADFNDIKSQFGLNENEPIFLDFPNHNDSEIVEPMLISISAFCDFAQNKARSEIFYLAGKIKASHYYKNLDGRKIKYSNTSPSIWKSPCFYYDGCDEAFVIVVNANRFITGAQFDKSLLTVNFRIKEQLINQLIVHITNHQSRPGIIQLF